MKTVLSQVVIDGLKALQDKKTKEYVAPKSLTDAVKNAMDEKMMGYSDEEISHIIAHIRNYQAQHFTMTTAKMDEANESIVLDLFKKVTRESI